MKNIFLYLLIAQSYFVSAQDLWQYENDYDHGFQILESYDGGVIIAATRNGQSYTGKIFKLNKAGDVLWDHTFEEYGGVVQPICMVEDVNGDLVVAGKTFQYQAEAGSFVMRLNACGELLWFKNIGVEDQFDFVSDMVLVAGGSVVLNIQSTEQRFFLHKIDELGNILWANSLEIERLWGGNPSGLYTCMDGGYTLVGSVYAPPYFDSLTTVGYLRGVVFKTDSLGALDWYNVFRWEEDSQDTSYLSSNQGLAQLSNGHFSVLSLNRNESLIPPFLYELDAHGSLLWHKNIAKPDTSYSNSKLALAGDSSIIVVTAASLPTSSMVKHTEVYRMDLQANKIAEFVDEYTTTIHRDIRLSRDSSYLYVLPGARIIGSSDNLYALKLDLYTMQLDSFLVEDTIIYDYYCPEGVEDLNFEFPEYVGIPEEQKVSEERLKIAPNPAREFTYLYFDIVDYNRSAKLEIHTMQGVLVNSYELNAVVGCIKEDLSHYTKGVYLVSIIANDRVVESSKMIVE